MARIRSSLQLGVVGAGIGLLLMLPSTVLGLVVASDNADPMDPAYIDGWQEDDNGGFGFLPWTGGMYANPFEIDADDLEPDNGLGAPAFRYGTGGFGYWAIRPFANPIAAGQSFTMDFDPFDFPTAANGEFQSLLRFGSAGGERFALYAYSYHDSGTVLFGSDNWGVGGATANDNLNGGTPMPTSPCYATGCTNYSLADSSDGFSLALDIVTIDTYRFRIVDDGVTKVDVSGQLAGGASSGQGITSVTLWSKDGDGATIDTSYFTNMQIATTPSAGVPGDYNSNGKVDGADYVVWRNNNGTGFQLPNEVTGITPGQVTPEDYAAWRARFGNTSGSGSGLVVANLPEPTSLVLVFVGCSLAFCRRRAR